MIHMKHDWEPVDNQGHEMVCEKCGKYIFFGSPEWDKEINADCPGADSKRGKTITLTDHNF